MVKKSKSTTGPSKFAKPYITQAAGVANSSYAQNNATAQAVGGQIRSLIPQFMERAQNGSPLLKAAQGYNTDVLQGKYLNGNPQLEAMIAKARGDTTDTVGARFGALGGYGGTKYAESLGKGLADSELGLRYQNYGDERDAMANAAANAPNLTNADFQGIVPLLALAQGGVEIPASASNDYIRNISGLMGNYNTTTNNPGWGNVLRDIMSDAAQAAAMSDRRLKTAIEKVGEFADGLGIYHWRYIWGGPVHEGVMADEVAKLRPWALGPEIHGFQSVNYGAL